MKHIKLILLLLFALASCTSTPPTDHRVFDLAISGDFGAGGYEYKAATPGLFVTTSASQGESYSALGRTWMLNGEVGAFAGLSVGQENRIGYEAGAHYFMEKGFVIGLRFNQLADAALVSIGYSF